MTAQMLLDQLRGRKNICVSDNYKLGETGFVQDRTVSGSNIYLNSGMLVEVMIVKSTGALTSPAGKGVVFDHATQGQTISGFSVDGGNSDGIVDPDLTGNLAAGDTFLLFRKGPMQIIASAAISAGAGVKAEDDGKFQTDGGSASQPVRRGRLMVAATADGQSRRAMMDFTIP